MKSLQLSSPHIIATVGIPGAGKSYFATEFAEMFGAPLLQFEKFAELSDDADKVHGVMLAVLAEMMKTRQTIVLDSVTERRVQRAELMKFARNTGYKVMFVWAQTDPGTARSRWMKQHGTDEHAFDAMMKQFSPPHATEPCVVISGKHTLSTQARTVLKRLADSKPVASTDSLIPSRPSQPQVMGGRRLHVG